MNEEDTIWTTHFIKMLQIAAKEGFAPRTTKKAIQLLRQKITSQDIICANQPAELGYIPHEDLQEIGMEILSDTGLDNW